MYRAGKPVEPLPSRQEVWREKKKSLDLVAGQAGGRGRGLVSGWGVGRQHLAPLQSPCVGPAREVPELCAVTPERQRTSARPTGRCGS